MAAILNKEKDGLSVALLEEAMQLFACRQRVRLLELQVLNLQQKPAMLMPAEEEAVGLSHEETVSVSWVLALIFSLGIGVATALAWGY